MSNNNSPFKNGERVVCVSNDVINSRVIKPIIGDYYTIKGPCPDHKSNYDIVELPRDKDGKLASYHHRYFRRVPPYSTSLSQQLAREAMKETKEIDVDIKETVKQES